MAQCENAIAWTKSFVEQQLTNVMFKGQANAKATAKEIVAKLSHYPTNRTHELHIHYEDCLKMGLKVKRLEDPGNEVDPEIRASSKVVSLWWLRVGISTPDPDIPSESQT